MPANIQLVAHRGYAAAYPENTQLSLGAAVQAGARFIEFDIQLTRDGVPVLLHDADFDRTGNISRIVYRTDFADLQSIDVGEPRRFGERFAGTPVCSLETIARQLAEWPEVTAFVELKRQSLEHFGVAAVLDTVLPILQPVISQCVVISFVADALYELRRRSAAPIGWAIKAWDEEAESRARQMAPEFLFCNADKLPEAPEPLWEGPWSWVIYEVVDPVQAVELYRRGVRMVETMHIADLSAALGDAGAN